MNGLERIFLNSRKDVMTERCEDGVFLWDVKELTFLKINQKKDRRGDGTLKWILGLDNNC